MKRNGSVLYTAAAVVAVWNAMLFFSMRQFWSGVYALAGVHSLPPILMAVLTLVAVLSVCLRGSRPARIALGILTAVFFAALCYMLSQAFPGWPFILREFWLLALRGVPVAAVGFLIFKLPYRIPRAACAAAVAVLAAAVFCLSYGIRPGGFDKGPAVFAVGREYQIVFTTKADSTAWVTVDGAAYFDTFNGSARSGTVHKITVPMDALDRAGAYEIGARTMVMRGPYDAIQGSTYTERVPFRMADDADGLHWYSLSDSHDFTKSAAQTASYWGDELDFLVLLGDHASFLTGEADLTRALELAHGTTGGSCAVVYARGNHEVKGTRATELYRYVGADGERFYYTFRLGSVWGVVLDAAEDHGDDWWEFYGTAHFDDYRREQAAFLRGLDAASEYQAPGVTTRIALCHIPLTVTYNNDFSPEIKRELVDALGGLDLTLLLSGHTHRLYWTTPALADGTKLTAQDERSIGTVLEAPFPMVIVSRHANAQFGAESETGGGNIGLALETTAGTTRLWYTNNTGAPIDLKDPFTGAPITQPLTAETLPIN